MSTELKTGVVTAVNPLQVRVGVSTIAGPAVVVPGYTPAVTHVVAVLDNGSLRVVLGRVT